MLIPAIFLGSLLQDEFPSINFNRADLAPVFDTYIDPSAPIENFGREPSLVLGSNRAILLDFPELSWHRFSGRKVKSARIILTLSRGANNIPLTISLVKKRWMEGDGRSLRFDRPDPANIPWGGATWNFAQQGKDGLKWSSGGGKGDSDISPVEGLTAEVIGRELILSGLGPAVQNRLENPWSSYGFRIETTAEAAFYSGEWNTERPRLDIQWEETSQAGADLALMTISRNAESGQYRAIFKNIGNEPISAATLEFASKGSEAQTVAVPGPFQPGTTKSITFQSLAKEDQSDPRKVIVQTHLVATGDLNLGNNNLEYFPAGKSIAFEASDESLEAIKAISPSGEPLLLYQTILAKVNNFVFPFSRYLKSPEGIKLRLNLALDPATADYRVNLNDLKDFTPNSLTAATIKSLVPLNLSWRNPPSADAPWSTSSDDNFSWLPDTRDDGLRLPGLELPVIGFESTNNPIPLWNNGLVSRVETAYLQTQVGRLKPTFDALWASIKPGILIKILGANGEDLKNTEVSLYRNSSTSPIASGNSANGGLVYIGGDQVQGGSLFNKLSENGADGWLLVKATRGGATASTWLPVWQVLDWSVRGNESIPNVELRFNLPSQTLDQTQNLAKERIVTDSASRFPAQLASLVDENPSTGVDLEPKQWVEIDLGRDRVIGAIDLTFLKANYPNLDIFGYGTSQNANAAIRWVELSNLTQLAKIYGVANPPSTTIPIIHAAMQMRYVRIVNRGDKPASLSEIKVIPIKAQG
ncbi:MAG: hypothetical protein ACKVQS_00070 [Fimbriimonadaceae bacterium]